jgi:hypothetical protein
MTLATLPCDVVGHKLKYVGINYYFWVTQRSMMQDLGNFLNFYSPKWSKSLEIKFLKSQQKEKQNFA